jgi:hypothetical protein
LVSLNPTSNRCCHLASNSSLKKKKMHICASFCLSVHE